MVFKDQCKSRFSLLTMGNVDLWKLSWKYIAVGMKGKRCLLEIYTDTIGKAYQCCHLTKINGSANHLQGSKNWNKVCYIPGKEVYVFKSFQRNQIKEGKSLYG